MEEVACATSFLLGGSMDVVIKKVNVHFVHQYRKKMWSFTTICEDGKKRYYVDTGQNCKAVSKTVGNKVYARLRECFPQSKAIIIIDRGKDSKVSCARAMDHWEVLVDGTFAESCDAAELNDVVEEYEKVMRNC